MRPRIHVWRFLPLSLATVASLSLSGCLDRPVAPATPKTSNTVTDQVRVNAVNKIDLLFMVDNSASMADKQAVLARAVPDLVNRLISPDCVQPNDDATQFTKVPKEADGSCPPGSEPEFNAIRDIHIGVITSSLGGHGSDYCSGPLVDSGPNANVDKQTRTENFTQNDRAHLITRGRRTDEKVIAFPNVETYDGQGFFNWDPDQEATPPGEKRVGELTPDGTIKEPGLTSFFGQVILGTDQVGCGYEASLEAWYRFLIDPSPPGTIAPSVDGVAPPAITDVDTVLLEQRASFLRPDSLVAIVNLSDENDCSIIDGALPPDVCDTPELDDDGNPTGECLIERRGWPPGYAEGNFQDWSADDEGRVTGTPFPVNHLAAQRKIGLNSFNLTSGTPACDDDPYSPECKSCTILGPGQGQGCADLSPKATPPPPIPDDNNLRCWNQKQRFGVDFLYPLKRYVDGLSQDKVYDRNGNLVTNPLYDDLPFKRNPEARAKAEPRDTQRVFYASIVGVPWQDIARDPTDLTKGYRPARGADDATEDADKGIDWDTILGDPFTLDKARRKGPSDPLMVEHTLPRSGQTAFGDQPLSQTSWNSVNGHEWNTGKVDLQYACIFELATPRECDLSKPGAVTGSCDCPKGDEAKKNPLCEKPEGQERKGNGVFSTTQYWAKAFPGTRFLQVAKDFGPNAIVASICTPNLKDEERDDFGYRPAVSAIIERLKTQLADRCLPRRLKFNNDNTTPCLIIDARFKKGLRPTGGDALAKYKADLEQCQQCDGKARKPIASNIAPLLSGGVLDYECRCELTQLRGDDLDQCQTNPKTVLESGNGGWCYVDPSTAKTDERKEAARKLVEKCDANNKHTIRFLDTETQDATLFITCLGDASDNELEAPVSP